MNSDDVFCRQRLAPTFWWDYELHDMPLPVFRAVLKKQFTNNAHLNDVRVIDRKVAECKQVSVSNGKGAAH